MHAGAASIQVARQQGWRSQRLVFRPLDKAHHVCGIEFLRGSAARLVWQRGKSVVPPAYVGGAHGAHVQTQLIGNGLGKQPGIEQQQGLRPLALAPVARASGDTLQLGAAVLIELQYFACRHGRACFEWSGASTVGNLKAEFYGNRLLIERLYATSSCLRATDTHYTNTAISRSHSHSILGPLRTIALGHRKASRPSNRLHCAVQLGVLGARFIVQDVCRLPFIGLQQQAHWQLWQASH